MQRLDRELGWVILSSSFLVFLLVSAVFVCYPAFPAGIPVPVALSRAYVGRAVFRTALAFLRYVSLGTMAFGLYGIIAWPSSGRDR